MQLKKKREKLWWIGKVGNTDFRLLSSNVVLWKIIEISRRSLAQKIRIGTYFFMLQFSLLEMFWKFALTREVNWIVRHDFLALSSIQNRFFYPVTPHDSVVNKMKLNFNVLSCYLDCFISCWQCTDFLDDIYKRKEKKKERKNRWKIAIRTQLLQISNSKYSHEKKNPNQTSKNFPYKFCNVLYSKEKKGTRKLSSWKKNFTP